MIFITYIIKIQLCLFVCAETAPISLHEDSGHSGELDIELDHASQRLKSLQVITGPILYAPTETVMPRVIGYADVVRELEPSS